MKNKLFNVYSIKRKDQQDSKYFLTLFDIDDKIFFVEIVKNLNDLNEQDLQNTVSVFANSKMSNLYCDLNAVYMSDQEEFSQFSKDANKELLLNNVDDIFKLSVLTKINEVIQSNDNKVNLVYLKNDYRNLETANKKEPEVSM
ncbi:Uncharacterised protein [Mycoplasmopsis columboralis]|uniref:Uncharacterized protein n=1 Tax=Mycoplasmopsis columboralis TaxID=171282 RepID=A0A449B6J2_9BACT|nr:hypothetical protein [Mycoplasmopsis columboralis]VEU76227.1 Uncharacterised protein [Mycoplasmopsis columboralis]